MFLLEDKTYLWLLLIIPVIVLLFGMLVIWKKRTQRKFADKELLQKLSPERSLGKSVLKVVVLSLAIASLAIALANPQFGTKLETVKREGVDVVFALDVSKSMLAEDIAPNRLEKSKQLVTQIINNLASDRVGIIAYAGSAFPQLPITTDYGAAKMFLQAMNTDMISSQGTAIKEAIELATTYFNDEDQTNRILFLISDGEDHEGQVEEIAEEAAREGIRIVTIGVGTAKGGPIPEKRRGVTQSYKKDNSGQTVITRLNAETLKEIANAANGEYIDGSVTTEVVEQVTTILQNMDKKEFESQQIAEYKSQFQWFLGLGLFFLFLDILLLERRTSWLKRLNLFNEEK
ncbi:Ca-activated chloride channel family protein [Salinimicrobium catena]|uniref:Ca-activated chloride channel family protein n=1 Tax=Salinimicrobium catena TaxID=390640 RepID=A0A1H5J1I8_9FLAO|nr:VWA domain-containing protein [Salinimicrobium catena]SDK83109.1 Ca-activated chloride channel family protein [Salinimicrobium catena]SEE46385.1 Ca-activated chloride channel family protein [Salinimicrobium catena]